MDCVSMWSLCPNYKPKPDKQCLYYEWANKCVREEKKGYCKKCKHYFIVKEGQEVCPIGCK